VNAVAGVATFSGLSLNRTGTGYTLVAASDGLAGITSTAFDVAPGAPATLSFVTQPGNTVAGDAISPAVQVSVRDAQGNLVAAPIAVTMSIANNPGGATLGGTTTINSSGGTATFANLTLDLAGDGYTLQASGAGLTATSAAFNVTPGPAVSVGFFVQPTNIQEGSSFSPDVAVEVRDAFGNRATGFVGSVSLQLRSESGGGAGPDNRLLGGGARAFVQGLAVFPDMTVNFTGGSSDLRTFTLRTNGTLAQVLSNAFSVSPL
jgi:hypothetical protein